MYGKDKPSLKNKKNVIFAASSCTAVSKLRERPKGYVRLCKAKTDDEILLAEASEDEGRNGRVVVPISIGSNGLENIGRPVWRNGRVVVPSR